MGKFKNLGAIATTKDYSWVSDKFITMMPNPDIVLKRLGVGVENYNELKTDPHLASCIQSRKSGVLSMNWEINRGGNKTDEVQFIYDVFENLDIRRIISDMLEAPLFGYQIMEILWRIIDGKIVPTEIIAKPHEWFNVDSNNLWRFKKKNSKNGVILPIKKFMTITHNATYTNPYGEPLLSKCYWSVFFKKDTIKFWSVFTEKYGMPIAWGKVGPGSASKDDLYEDLDILKQDGVLVTEGDETNIALLDATRASSPDLYAKFILFHNAEISKAILSQTLTTEQGATGSYAMSQTHLQVRKDVVDADKRLVEMWMNKLIRWIIEYNFENKIEAPVFELFEEEDVDMVLADRDSKLSSMVKFNKTYFKKYYGLADDEFEINETPQNFGTSEKVQEINKPKDIGLNDLSDIGNKMIDPVLNLIEEGNNYDEIYDKISNLLPEIETEEIEDIISKGILIANSGGRI